jgi:hypothetical protein
MLDTSWELPTPEKRPVGFSWESEVSSLPWSTASLALRLDLSLAFTTSPFIAACADISVDPGSIL